MLWCELLKLTPQPTCGKRAWKIGKNSYPFQSYPKACLIVKKNFKTSERATAPSQLRKQKTLKQNPNPEPSSRRLRSHKPLWQFRIFNNKSFRLFYNNNSCNNRFSSSIYKMRISKRLLRLLTPPKSKKSCKALTRNNNLFSKNP